MAAPPQVDVALETGARRTFASALAWPGWSRSGRDEAAALDALLTYGPRYRHAIENAAPAFEQPEHISAFKVAERLPGNATTDLGAPGVPPAYDSAPLDETELERQSGILNAGWDAFLNAAAAGGDKPLTLGQRGGGRSLKQIQDHVMEAHFNYLRLLARPEPYAGTAGFAALVDAARQADAKALTRAVHEEIPETGPRGGKLWTPRYFIRRAAWHILDHAWEIEDRTVK